MPAAGPCYYAISPQHTHPAYSFVLNFDDQTSLSFGGKSLNSEPGKFVAISPGVPHEEHPSDSVSRYIAIFIARELFESQATLYPGMEEMPGFEGDSYASPSGLMRAIRAFMSEYEGRLPGCGAVLEGLGLEITHLIIRAVLNLSIESERVEQRVGVDRVVQYLNSNYGEKITVSDMADMAALSQSHFARIFKAETGRSPFDYLLNLRLEKARKMLRAGDLSITEAALRCGFNSPSHFSACFKKSYSFTPLKYKKSMAGS